MTTTDQEATMTTDPTTSSPDTATSPQDAPDPTSGTITNPETPQDAQQAIHDNTGRAGQDAARYRARLRDTEAERDQLRAQLDAMRRAEVDRITADHRLGAKALWAAGIELEQLLDEDGTVSPTRVAEAVVTTRTALGIPRTALPKAPSAYGLGSQGADVHSAPSERDELADALTPRR